MEGQQTTEAALGSTKENPLPDIYKQLGLKTSDEKINYLLGCYELYEEDHKILKGLFGQRKDDEALSFLEKAALEDYYKGECVFPISF